MLLVSSGVMLGLAADEKRDSKVRRFNVQLVVGGARPGFGRESLAGNENVDCVSVYTYRRRLKDTWPNPSTVNSP